MIPTDLVIAQLVPELHSTLSVGPVGALVIAIAVGLLAAVVVGMISDLRAERRQGDRGGHGQPARGVERPRLSLRSAVPTSRRARRPRDPRAIDRVGPAASRSAPAW